MGRSNIITRFLQLAIVWLLLLPGLTARGQIITTYAGGGTSVAEGVPATATWLLFPTAFAMNAAGDLLVCEENHGKIRKISPVGLVTSIAGNGTAGFSGDSGPATLAQLSAPASIATDAADALYIADYQNKRVRKVNASGIISTIAGNGVLGYTGDGGPATAAEIDLISVAVDAAGNVYFGSSYSVRKVSTSGIITTVAGGTPGSGGDGGPATAAGLSGISDVCFDAIGNLYIADHANFRIRKVNTAGIISTVAGNG